MSGTLTPQAVVNRFWQLMASNDFHQVKAVLADDFVLEWPQTDECIRGPERFATMNAEYPTTGRWSFTVERLLAQGDSVATVVSISDGTQSALALSWFTVANGQITRLVEYWPEPYAPPANRSHLTEALRPVGER